MATSEGKRTVVHLAALIARHNERLEPGREALDQKRLAEAIGTSEAQVSRHINGANLMTFETACRYAGFFEVRVAEVDDRFSDALDLPTLPTDRRNGTEG